ncbi:MAG: hypothetical protein HOP03_15355 [Lysobacter sp.]|nr:hypothetical protein [Lysobacter sp.]
MQNNQDVTLSQLASLQKVDTKADHKILQARVGVAAAGCADPTNQALHRVHRCWRGSDRRYWR